MIRTLMSGWFIFSHAKHPTLLTQCHVCEMFRPLEKDAKNNHCMSVADLFYNSDWIFTKDPLISLEIPSLMSFLRNLHWFVLFVSFHNRSPHMPCVWNMLRLSHIVWWFTKSFYFMSCGATSQFMFIIRMIFHWKDNMQ